MDSRTELVDDFDLDEASNDPSFENPEKTLKFPVVSWISTYPDSLAKKKRGRPRKLLQQVQGITVHNCENDQIYKLISAQDKIRIEKKFQEFQKVGTPSKLAIETISKELELPYRQVYDIAAKFI